MPLNTEPLNTSPVIQPQNIQNWSSFTYFPTSQYSFLCSNGMYYNFQNKVHKSDIWGNFLIKHNFHDTPKRKIESYFYPNRHGGKVTSIQDQQNVFNLSFIVQADTIQHLHQEIHNIKKYFSHGGVLVWKHQGKTYTLEVICPDEIRIDDIALYETTVTLVLASFTPYWQEENIYIQSYQQNTGNTEFTFFIPWDIIQDGRIIFQIHEASEGMQTLKITLNGAIVAFQDTFQSWDILEINTTKKEITKNTHSLPYSGIIANMQSGKNTFFLETKDSATFKYSLFFLYHNNIL